MWSRLKEKHPVAYEVIQWAILGMAVTALALNILIINR